MVPFAYPDNPIVWIVVMILLTGMSIPRIRKFLKDNKEEKKRKITAVLLAVLVSFIMIVLIGAITMILS